MGNARGRARGGKWAMAVWVAILCGTALAAESPFQNPPHPEVPRFRFHGALIRVTDMEAARAFYVETLGFAVRSDQGVPRTVRLGGDFPLYLRQVPAAPAQAGGGGRDVAHTEVAFMTADIARRTAALRRAGVVFLEDAPQEVGVGLAIEFRDPFGTVHSLLQQTIVEPDPFEEPKVYNSGFVHPKVAEVRPLYVDALGFVVRTEKYFPPALPLGHADGSFAFMLHEQAGLRRAADAYPAGPGTTLIFTTPDVAAAMAYLTARGVETFRPGPRRTVPEGIAAFRDCYGVVSEIWPERAARP